MQIPQTYEEFLKTPKTDLLKISKNEMSLEDARRFISYLDKLDTEDKSKLINENNNMNKTFWEELYG